MRERSSTDLSHPAEATPPRERFGRSLLGYRRRQVDEAMMGLRLRAHELEEEAVALREELLDARHETSETRHDLTRAKAELRYWNDRASYVDSEVARARARATELEQTARERAEAIEADAQERSLQLIDRVCTEANAMLQHAREEAREMFLRFETDVDMSQQKLDKLERVRGEVARSMQAALQQFEDAVRELDKVGPVKRIVESLEEPVRRSAPTFGTQKAMDAARRFEDASSHTAAAALSTPIAADAGTDEAPGIDEPTVLPAVAASDLEVGEETQVMVSLAIDEPIEATTPTDGSMYGTGSAPQPTTSNGNGHKKQHDADEEFASLLINP